MDKKHFILQIIILCLLAAIFVLKILEIKPAHKADILNIEEYDFSYEESQETTNETSQIVVMLAEIQDSINVLRRNVSSQAGRGRDEEIVGMLTEKLTNDYTESALKYFKEEDYNNAINTFTLALRHQPDNTTLQFYLLYSAYLRQRLITLTEDELTELQTNANELRNGKFAESEQLEHSIDDMNAILNEISNNIDEMLNQKDDDNEAQ